MKSTFWKIWLNKEQSEQLEKSLTKKGFNSFDIETSGKSISIYLNGKKILEDVAE